jgi:putative membrane protein
MLKIAKALLALFWLLALVNLVQPFAGPYLGWIALLILLVHVLEIALLHGRLQRQAEPWKDRLLVLLFGVLHVRGMRSA